MLSTVIVVFTLVVSTTVTALPGQAPSLEEFRQWQSLMGKSYVTAAEEAIRHDIFVRNAAFIDEHNADPKTTFLLGRTKFADLTNAEYRSKYLGLRRRPSAHRPMAEAMPLAAGDIPDSFDWRDKNLVNAIKDQGQCGSCWAFSATAAMETAWALKSGTLLSLSEQMCVDCVNGGADNCNEGGEMHDCYLQVIKQGGDETEADYPYTERSKGVCKYDQTKAVTRFSSYVNVTQYNETALRYAAAQSVVSVAIDASSLWFQLYSGGVFNLPAPYCKTDWNDLDHGVAVVGYGALNGTSYWTVRNSWGVFWGMQGYILMSRDANNQCGIATDATLPKTA